MDIETRLARLEERLTWVQRHIVEQDRIISTQSFEIDALKAKLASIKKQVNEGPQPGGSATEERPPHY